MKSRDVGSSFSAPLGALGFTREGDLAFRRERGECSHRILFATKRRSIEAVSVTAGMGSIFPAVDALYRPGRGEGYTFGGLVHLFAEPRTYREWEFRRDRDNASSVDEIMKEITQRGLQYLETISSLAGVRARLESPSSREWLALDPIGRIALLASVQWVQGEKESAVRLLEESIVSSRSRPQKCWSRLRELLDRLHAAG